jgi:hypothetical protein
MTPETLDDPMLNRRPGARKDYILSFFFLLEGAMFLRDASPEERDPRSKEEQEVASDVTIVIPEIVWGDEGPVHD